MSVSIVFRKDKLNKNNEAPVHFRIIKNRKVSYITSGLMIPFDCWDFSKNNIKGKFPNSARLNSFLANKFAEIQDKVYEFETKAKSTTSRQLRDNVYGKKPTDFFSFADSVLQEYIDNEQFSTYDKNKGAIAKLQRYLNGKSIDFQDITPEFLEKYERYLKVTINNRPNSIAKNFKFFRKLFNDACRKNLIERELDPFTKFQIKYEKTERHYLSEDELTLIENFEAQQGSRMELSRDMFIIASNTGGIRVSDLIKLRWKDFDGTHINFTMHKTKSQLSIKVPNKSIAILNKYKPEEPNKNSFVFPLLKKPLEEYSKLELKTALNNANSLLNNNLKTIAEKINLDKKLSFHISRHSWATRALRKEIPIEIVSKILGHTNIRETQIYAKVVSASIDKAMDAFND